MKEKLGRAHPGEERVGDETLRRRGLLAAFEVRQRTLGESVGGTHAPDCLLPHARHHLRYVNRGPFAPAQRHDERRVVARELVEAHVTGSLADGGEDTQHLRLERLLRVAPGLKRESSSLESLDALVARVVSAVHNLALLILEPVARGDVVDTDGEPAGAEPSGGELGHPVHARRRPLGPVFAVEDVEEPVFVAAAQRGFAQLPAHDLRVLYTHVAVPWAHVFVIVFAVILLGDFEVDEDPVRGPWADQHAKQLLPGPQLHRLDDRGGGQVHRHQGIAHVRDQGSNLGTIQEVIPGRQDVRSG